MTRKVASAEKHGLVIHRQGVAHAAVRLLSYDMKRFVVVGDTLAIGYEPEIPHHVVYLYALEIVYLATRKYRRYDLMFLGGRQYEYGMCGRLLQRLEKGVERSRRQHVGLVDDVDAVAAYLRRYAHLLGKGAYVIHRVVGGGVQLVYVERAVIVERTARLALVTRLRVGTRRHAVDGLGKNAGAGGLAHTARTAEKIGVGKRTARHGVAQRVGNVLLPYYRLESHGPVFTCRYYEIAHVLLLNILQR